MFNKEEKSVIFDYSPKSLISLWEWFEGKIEFVEKRKVELESEVEANPAWAKEFILANTKKFSDQTLIMALDMMIYFGETMIFNNSEIYWGYETKPKNLVGLNRPRLMGFNNGKGSLDIYNSIDVCMRRSMRKENKFELEELYWIWKGHI